jgi:multicomponent Na+:H+ antiporter subunit D
MIWIIEHSPALIIALPLATAFLCPIVSRFGSGARNLWVLIGAGLTTFVALIAAQAVFLSGPLVYTFGAAAQYLTVPEGAAMPIRIIFNIDAMSAIMVMLTAIIGFAVTVYAISSEERSTGLDGFFALFFLLMAGVYGLVCTGDLFNFFVFLEITGLSGAALIAFRCEKGRATEAGFKYALLSTTAGLFILIGIGILYGQYGALNMSTIAERLQYTRLDKIALALFIIPLALKCGAVPMHFWKPDAYGRAPASMSAFLVLSSQASLYGMMRILFSVYGVQAPANFGWVVIILGVLSMVVGVTMALPQKDLKRFIAYLAVAQTGYMLMAFGTGFAVLNDPAALESFGRTAIAGGIFHMFNDTLYKGLIFLTAGAVVYATGKKKIDELGGLGRSMKVTMVCFGIAALATSGIPPFNGFASKLMIYESVFRFNPFLAVIAMVCSVLTLASVMKIFHSVFMGPARKEFADVNEVPATMTFSMILLSVLCIVLGLFAGPFVEQFINPAVTALIDQSGYIGTVLGGM